MVKVNSIIKSIHINGSSDFQVYNKLMRKFELEKKLFCSYDDKLNTPATQKELSREDYQQLAVCFLIQTIKHKDIRFYNTALKIKDLADIQLPEIKFVGR